MISPTEIRSIREQFKELKTANSEGKGEYKKVPAENKAKIADCALKNGVLAAIQHFKCTGTFTDLKESTVHGWKNAYCSKILFSRKRDADHKPVSTLPEKWLGRPLLIGQELEDKVKCFLTELRESGGVVNFQVTISTANGVVKARDANLLVENSGSIDISKD